MRFSSSAVSAWLAAAGVLDFTASTTMAFVAGPAFVSGITKLSSGTDKHQVGCLCRECTGTHAPGLRRASGGCALIRSLSCSCATCARGKSTRLFADATETEVAEDLTAVAEAEISTDGVLDQASEATKIPAEEDASDDVPAEVEAMDGIESQDEAHNAERNYRGSLKKHKRSQQTSLSDLEVGAKVTGKVKKIASYGAFVDIGAQVDGLLHISRMAEGFVNDVSEIVKEGESIEVTIFGVDSVKNQVSLTMISEKPQRDQRRGGGGNQRKDYSATHAQLLEKGWDEDKFVEGTVENTLDFGAFVKVDASLLNEEVEGVMDGLVHISSLMVGRANAVTDVVSVGDKVQVRLKAISNGKVSLSMISAEDEKPRGGPRGGGDAPFEGAKDWKESLAKVQEDLPVFRNMPRVIDNRKETAKEAVIVE